MAHPALSFFKVRQLSCKSLECYMHILTWKTDLHAEGTNAIILQPQPTDDPNDPLVS